ncbi:MAG: M1 family peptidase, partial [Ferruginibacter sp.]
MQKSMFMLTVMVSLFYAGFGQADTKTTTSNYDPHDLFSPMFYPGTGTITRAATGEPNVGYWQNRADYNIEVSLDENTHVIKGSVTISYKNNSPHFLPFIWLQLDQNLFKKDSRGQARMPVGARSRYGDAGSDFSGGYNISSVKIQGDNAMPEFTITDTRMQVRLPKPLKPGGDVLNLKIDYSFILPAYGADRCGIMPTKNGDIFSVAQWYPRMCVFDDVEGWNTLPYLGPSEFYLEYGDFNFSITAPASHTVVASGELQNASDVLGSTLVKRLDNARNSDATVSIISQEEMLAAAKAPRTGTRTWKFKMQNARDVSWASSKAFIWDAARINLPEGKKA